MIDPYGHTTPIIDNSITSGAPTAGNILSAVNILRPFINNYQYGCFDIEFVDIHECVMHSCPLPFDFRLSECTEQRMRVDWLPNLDIDTLYRMQIRARFTDISGFSTEYIIFAWTTNSEQLQNLWIAHNTL